MEITAMLEGRIKKHLNEKICWKNQVMKNGELYEKLLKSGYILCIHKKKYEVDMQTGIFSFSTLEKIKTEYRLKNDDMFITIPKMIYDYYLINQEVKTMLKQDQIDEMVKWLEQNKERTLNVKFENYPNGVEVTMWFYSRNLNTGKHIKLPESYFHIPDLEKIKEEEDIKELNRLKEKYENGLSEGE